MNVLVTGAAGYVGSIVTERLLSEGHRVISLDNLGQGHRPSSRTYIPHGSLSGTSSIS